MPVNDNLVTLASNLSMAAANVKAASVGPSEQFYSSPDGWVCFGLLGQPLDVPSIWGRGRLWASLTPDDDAAKLNAIRQASMDAKQADAMSKAQQAYDGAAAAVAQGAKA